MKIKRVVDWLAKPFDSTRLFVIFVCALPIGSLPDIGSTYYFLSESDWNFSLEGSEIIRWFFLRFGFYVGTLLYMILVMIVVTLGVRFASVAMIGYRCRRVFLMTIIVFMGIIGPLVALCNIVGYNSFSAGGSFYLDSIWPLFIAKGVGFYVIFFLLYVFGFGKRKEHVVQSTEN